MEVPQIMGHGKGTEAEGCMDEEYQSPEDNADAERYDSRGCPDDEAAVGNGSDGD